MFCTVCATANARDGHRCVACGALLVRDGGPRSRRGHIRPLLLRLVYLTPVLALLVAGGVGFGLTRLRDAEEQSQWYERAEAAAASGRYLEALDAFDAAGGYRDAEARHAEVAAQLVPYADAYEKGVVALDAGRYDEAIALLLPVARDLPDYEDVTLLLGQARAAREDALRREADAAEARADWLAAERALATLVAADPDDPLLTERLATVRRDHAPLVFARDHGLYLTGPDLVGERLVTAAVPAAWPVWSPDRTRIAFISHEMTDDTYDGRLYVVNADGTGLTELADWVYPYSWPVWSPDGAKIAYTNFSSFGVTEDSWTISVHIMDLATRQETVVRTDRPDEASSGASWSPTGDRLAFVSRQVIIDVEGELTLRGGDVQILTLATGEMTNVTGGRLPDVWRALWSPTDEQVLLMSATPTGPSTQRTAIHRLDLRSGAVIDVNTTSGEVALPFWSPDGTHFAYVDGETTVRIGSLQAGEVMATVPTPVAFYLTWAPDGRSLIAPAVDPFLASQRISLDDPTTVTPLHLAYDVEGRSAGAPQWSSWNPPEIAGPPTTAGTASDPPR